MSRIAVGLIAAGACLAVAAPAAAQGLGDAAKKEKQRREKSAPTAKSYSEEDLEKMPPIANEEDASKPAPAATPSRDATIDPTRRDEPDRRVQEDRWRARVAQARAQVEEAQAHYEQAASLTLVPGYELVDANNQVVARSVEELQENTARARSRLEAAEKALEDLLESARRQGVPPGWLR